MLDSDWNVYFFIKQEQLDRPRCHGDSTASEEYDHLPEYGQLRCSSKERAKHGSSGFSSELNPKIDEEAKKEDKRGEVYDVIVV